MSQLLKSLSEQRGAKHKEAQTIIEKVTAEKRGFTDDERSTVNGLQNEIDKFDADIEIEVRNISQATKVGPQFSKQEERDIGKFQLGKVVAHLDRVFRGQPSQLDGIEREMGEEGIKESRAAGVNVGGFVVPTMLIANRESRATLSATGGTTAQYGGELVATEVGGIFGDFYNNSVMEANGATVLTGLMNNLNLPNYIQGSAPAKKTENEAAGDVAGTFTALELSPNRLAGYAVISDQLMMQSAENVGRVVGAEISNAMRAVKELAFFHGAGTNEPVGIAATSGIGSVVGGTNGAAPDWADIVDLETAIAIDDVSGEIVYFTNPTVRGKLKKTLVTATYGDYHVWDSRSPNAPLNGYRAAITNAIKKTLTKGTSSGVCSAIFAGVPRHYYIGYWGGVSLEIVRDSTDAKAGQRTLVANAYYDGGLRKAQAFSAMLDALTA